MSRGNRRKGRKARKAREGGDVAGPNETTPDEIAGLDDEAAMQGTPWYTLVSGLDEDAERELMDHWQSYAMSAMQGGADAITAALDADVMMVEHMSRKSALPLPAVEMPPPDETPPAANAT